MLEIRHLMGMQMLRETGSMLEAAKKLQLTQSALSHQFSGLEKRLGTLLFERRSRPVRFTRTGRRILKLADSLLPELFSIEHDLVGLADAANGRINMAVESADWAHWLIPLINRFRGEWTEIKLDVLTQYPALPFAALDGMDVDLLLTTESTRLPGIVSVPLFTYEVLLGVANNHPLAREAFIAPSDLANQVLITSPGERRHLPVFEKFLTPAGFEPASHRQSDSLVSLTHQVASGRAVCCLPEWVIRGVSARGVLSAKKLGREGLHVTLYAVLSQEALKAPHMRHFLLAAQEGPRG